MPRARSSRRTDIDSCTSNPTKSWQFYSKFSCCATETMKINNERTQMLVSVTLTRLLFRFTSNVYYKYKLNVVLMISVAFYLSFCKKCTHASTDDTNAALPTFCFYIIIYRITLKIIRIYTKVLLSNNPSLHVSIFGYDNRQSDDFKLMKREREKGARGRERWGFKL